jgi:hypothetical protein
MVDHIQVRLISLIEDAANSLEQLETLSNRILSEIPADNVLDVRLEPLAREVMDDTDQLMSETDHVMFIRYRDVKSKPQ